jgi:hypothetical protein
VNKHRKEQAQQIGIGALVGVGILASGAIGCVLWILAVMYV